MSENYFKELYNTPVKEKIDQKNGLNYLRWAAAWGEVKKHDANATYNVHTQDFNVVERIESKEVSYSIQRPWFTDSTTGTGWVKTSVTVHGITHTEILPIMDHRNQPIPADKIKSTEANKSIQRAITKACARHGIGLVLYEAEVEVEDDRELAKARQQCLDVMGKKGKVEKLAPKVEELCKTILAEENGDPRICEDIEKLKGLNKKLLALR